ncbi:FAD-binding protein [Streptomyces sp. TRM49041]|uniref:FAD-binding oxidoreductase n=1 Tax=Streptomyces sp. TRM49041 TaxID=2603216 RepID=UPI0011EF6EFF|nr:FAD-dependent oxidoreductase [Streptomyces sp. TRM49041]
MTTAVSSTPSPTVPALDPLRDAVRGDVIDPSDPRYDEARRVYNAMHDRRPAVVVRAVDAADAIAAVNFARDHDLPLAVRGGAHAATGHGTCDDGLVLDLGRMRSVHVDAEHRTARAEGGCTWGDFNHATHAFGLATTGGVVSSTGIGGLTLGGGMGHLARRYGLTCDNLISADVVTADGTLVRCDADHDAELFWALRGGGGNFGAVVSFLYRVHPVADILGGPTFYPLDGDVARRWRELIADPDTPDAFNAVFAFVLGPPVPFLPERWHGRPLCAVLTCWTGPEQDDERIRARLGGLGPVLGQFVERMPYPVINTLFDADLPAGLYHYWKGNFSRDLSDGAVDVHTTYAQTLPSMQTNTIVFPIDRACHRVGPTDTAFAYRDATFSTGLGPSFADPSDIERNVAWCRDYDRALRPHTEEGGYINFLSDDDQDRVRTNYRQNYDRLVELKRRYDPGNLFRVNHNITP